MLDFLHLAQYPTHNDTTLQYLDVALEKFHENCDILVEIGVRVNFNIPKLHSLTHYIDSSNYLVLTDNYNTDTLSIFI